MILRKNNLWFVVMLLLAIAFTGCEKNDIDEAGSFNIKVVNAAPGSAEQSFTLAGNKLISAGLAFTESSSYINTPSGKRLVEEFRDANTNTLTANGELWTANGVSFTVYLAGEGSSLRVKSFEDDLSAPNNGRVKIKFIHLSDGAPSDINIKDGNDDNLITNISRNIQSGYKFVAPGTLSVRIYGTASRRNLANFDVNDLQAGKIYTLYLTGSDDSNLQLNKVLHN
ncbi:DUF4397 domain-containing protein [Mucilaginibacter sp. UR6-1]|uniref:DUF4397 domain-containing protein n=1 Tax=Mucilaginibacter sp. UR6-1 TaxID=1435643 RepID=UPI001E6455D8|nr:DUF4397 domain-containing protein [Mucilaginibacter sp. UR6-1]MCC8408119.1 DUF4397 domain-containing protein [Mucilaginibacter sp. UR6-1]